MIADIAVLKWNIVCIFCSTTAPCLKAFALSGRDCSNTRTQGVASLALGLVLLAFQAVPVQIRNLSYIQTIPNLSLRWKSANVHRKQYLDWIVEDSRPHHFLCHRMACIENRWDTLKGARQKSGTWGLYHTTKTYTPSILHLTLTRYNSLIVNTLLSVRCDKFHLHASYTTCTLPHGTSTGGERHSIGEQKSLLLRQISLRPCGV